jgi:Domain of unknown function (DUF4388)
MTELSGMLDGLGLTAIVRFLSGLHKTGCLRLSQDDWHGEILFKDGRLAHAELGTRTGLPALDALVEVLPVASFTFDSQVVPSGEPTVHLEGDGLLAHLEETAARVARGERTLPAVDAVPSPITGDNGTEDPIQLDRATLQTLLAVDGERTVREVVARRGSMDALWHLGTLLNAGLIELGAPRPPVSRTAAPEPQAPPAAEAAAPLPVIAEPPRASVVAVQPVAAAAPPEMAARAPEAAPTTVATHCPKLGFEDDPASSFGRPTRLHRCFAVGRPLPLSLDQQRELCLSEQYGTCPRLAGAAPNQPWRVARPVSPRVEPAAPRSDEPRIVRLPLAGRPIPPERDVPSNLAPDPRPLRPVSSTDVPNGQTIAAPTPLRARLNRTPTATAETASMAPAPGPIADAAPVPPRRRREPAPEPPAIPDAGVQERRFGSLPLIAIPVVGVIVLAVAAVLYLVPQWDALFGDNTIDPATLPNTSLVQAGTPVANLGLSRLTPVPGRATPGLAASADAANQSSDATTQPTADATSSPTFQATALPSVAGAQTSAPIFDERFTANDAGWPSNASGAALMTNGTYRISTRQAGQFAAVGAPVANVPDDVVISASFRKLAGPPGGGYGIIVRDQETSLRDGTSQDGHYYVLEAGDKGEVGIWRRDADHWVDLLPWQHSDAVKTGTETNELSVRAVGSSLSLIVNGTQVATRTDNSFTSGRAGLFVGGDGNQVAISRYTIQAP